MSGWLKTSPAPLIQDNFEEPSQLHRSARVSPLLGCNRTAVQLLPPPSPTSLPPSQVLILRTTLINPLQESVPWMQVTNSMTKEWQSLALRGHLSSCTLRLLPQGHRKVRGTSAQLGERCIRIDQKQKPPRKKLQGGKIHKRRRPRQNAACFFQSTPDTLLFFPRSQTLWFLQTSHCEWTSHRGREDPLWGFSFGKGKKQNGLNSLSPRAKSQRISPYTTPSSSPRKCLLFTQVGRRPDLLQNSSVRICVHGHRLLLLLLLCLKALQATLLYTQCKDYRPKGRKEYRRSWEGNSLPFYW